MIGENRASFVSSPVNTQKHDTFLSNYTMSSVYSPGMACTIGAIRLVPVLRGISAGSRCHCRTNGVISTAIRLILFKLKKMITLPLDSLLLDNLQPDVGSVCSHGVTLAVTSICISMYLRTIVDIQVEFTLASSCIGSYHLLSRSLSRYYNKSFIYSLCME